MIITFQVHCLIKQGIPHIMRCKLWPRISGSMSKSIKSNLSYKVNGVGLCNNTCYIFAHQNNCCCDWNICCDRRPGRNFSTSVGMLHFHRNFQYYLSVISFINLFINYFFKCDIRPGYSSQLLGWRHSHNSYDRTRSCQNQHQQRFLPNNKRQWGQ